MGFAKEIDDISLNGINMGDLSVSEYFYGSDDLSYKELPYCEALDFLIVKCESTVELLFKEDLLSRDDVRIFYILKRVDMLRQLREE